VGPGNPWIFLGYASSILLLAFVIDASVRLWRQGTPDGRRRAVTVGGGIVFFIVAAQSVSVLVNVGKINLPYVSCIPFLAIVVAMGFELTYDVIRAAQLSRALQASSAALRESEERMSLATESARLSLWEWDVARGEIWMTAEGRSLLGFKPEEPLNYAALAGRVHPEDRAARETAIQRALETRGSYEMEYRVLGPDGAVRWIAARGRCTRADNVAAPRLLGVSLDITRQKLADAEMRQQRDDLGHLGRVALVGEMATSLAHELNQPLTAIVTNASTAKKILARGELKPGDLRELLADIAADGSRASEVIRGIKDMVRKVPSERHAVNLNEVIANALRLVRPDALTSDCTLATDLVPALPAVTGDAVQLQQVLLNLVVNALDAIRQTPATPRRIEISSRLVDGEFVEISVRDTGPGLPAGSPGRVFDRFFSTKPEGMGMGLAIARSIIEAHNGTLQAENTASEAARTKGYLPSQLRGARFWFRLPVRVAALVEVKA
jgi:two-component system sensor kinase FixL